MAALRFERVAILAWVDIIAMYTLWMLMTYLTSVWDLSISHAAAVVNIFWSFLLLSPFFLSILVDTIIRNYWMVTVSTISFSVGLGFLTMSTPPVLARITGNCSEYIPECVGQSQKVLFYTSLPLIASGGAVHLSFFKAFLEEQFIEEGDDRRTNIAVLDWLLLRFRVLAIPIFTVIAVVGLPYIKPWSIRFGIPAICTLVATLAFLSASCSYKYVKPIGISPLATFFKVLVAAASKLFYSIPRDTNELFEIQDNPQLHLVPHSTSLRCLDKAAIVVPKPLHKQMWRLCRVTQVEETKAIIRMIPVWLTFVLCGAVSSISATFFIEQLDHMNPKVGRLKVPTLVLIWFQLEVLKHCGVLSVRLARTFFEPTLRMFGFVGIVISMILTILCCITCGKVENRRLGLVRNHQVTMSMFWLLPQFVLFGVFRGVFDGGLLCLFNVKDSKAVMYMYLPIFANCVRGVGCLCSIVLVFVVGKISERGGKMNWFQHDLNESKLDKYYYTLAWLIAVNLVVFVVAAMLYRCNEWKLEDEQAAAGS